MEINITAAGEAQNISMMRVLAMWSKRARNRSVLFEDPSDIHTITDTSLAYKDLIICS